MSYQVIARKYRPQRFADVVGQDHVARTLSNAIEQNRIAHAYLFVGPRGTGKTTLARIFAKCLNCTGGPSTEFSDDDPRVLEITEGRSLDVLEIDGASNRGIEEIRELRDTVRYRPATGRFKVYIIDEVHMLTKEAFNALLKTLEEPPEHVKFMFATTEPEKVLPTILSRCQRFDLRRIPTPLIVKHLGYIAGEEKVSIDQGALHAVARGSDGCMRDAESILDQLISFCGSHIVENDVLGMFGLTARGQLLEIANAILGGDSSRALKELNQLARSGKDLSRLLTDLLGHFRNLLVYRISQGDLSLLEVTEAEAETLKQQAGEADEGVLTRIMEVLSASESRLREAISKKTWIEVALLKAIQVRQSVPLDAVLTKLVELRKNAGVEQLGNAENSGGAGMQAGPPAAAVSRAPVPGPAARAPSAAGADPVRGSQADPRSERSLEEIWAEVVERVSQASRFTRAYLIRAHPISWSNQVLVIGLDPDDEEISCLIDTPKTKALLVGALKELGFAKASIRITSAKPASDRVSLVREEPEPEPASGHEPIPESGGHRISRTEKPKPEAGEAAKPVVQPILIDKEEFKNDPLIKQALEIFKGQIVEVRA